MYVETQLFGWTAFGRDLLAAPLDGTKHGAAMATGSGGGGQGLGCGSFYDSAAGRWRCVEPVSRAWGAARKRLAWLLPHHLDVGI